MELPLEAYMSIARHVGTRRELASLCRVSRGFRNAAERVLYNTIHMHDYVQTALICRVLANSVHLALLVNAISIHVSGSGSDSESSPIPPPDDYWGLLALALQQTKRLRFLNIYIDESSDMGNAWVLDSCTFQLRTFHCDFSWDEHLVAFLNSQSSLTDLYILDFQKDTNNHTGALNLQALPKLSVLECTFMEAASTLASNRPLSRLKSCFTSSHVDDKRGEMATLFTNMRRSRRHIRALDIADSVYNSEFSLQFLTEVAATFSNSHLRYLGTLALPIDGREVRIIPLPRAFLCFPIPDPNPSPSLAYTVLRLAHAPASPPMCRA